MSAPSVAAQAAGVAVQPAFPPGSTGSLPPQAASAPAERASRTAWRFVSKVMVCSWVWADVRAVRRSETKRACVLVRRRTGHDPVTAPGAATRADDVRATDAR